MRALKSGVMLLNDFTGKRVLILVEPYAGRDGTCIGKSADGTRWAISPDDSNEILQLHFEQEFGLLINSPKAGHRRDS